MIMLMVVQCQFNSGLKINSSPTPQNKGCLKTQNFMSWPKLSSELAFGFMASSLESAYTWVNLGLDKFAAS